MTRNPSSTIRSVTGLVLVAMSMYGMGCALEAGELDPSVAADPDGTELGVAEQGVGGYPGTHNHLRPRCHWDQGAQQTARNLANGPIANATNSMPAMPYMLPNNAAGEDAGCRREFLEVLVGCALDWGTFVVDNNDPVYFNEDFIGKYYAGEIGLAPEWSTRALTTTERQLVTACVLARVNRYGEEVDVLLEGNHTSITHAQAVKDEYPALESSTWGNMFDSTVVLNPTRNPLLPSPIGFKAYVCQETATCSTGIAGMLRGCDSDACGFNYVGNCDDVATTCSARTTTGTFGSSPAYCAGRSNKIRVRLREADMMCIDLPF
jgi:hypothetical protein